MRPIKFNVGLPNGDPAATLATARRAEELGYYSVSIDDHFFMRGLMADVRAPHCECFTMLSAVAAATKSIRMLPLVTSMSYRNPSLLAKEPGDYRENLRKICGIVNLHNAPAHLVRAARPVARKQEDTQEPENRVPRCP